MISPFEKPIRFEKVVVLHEIFYKNVILLNSFLANFSILYTLKIPENQPKFLVFSGGMKWEHWPEMGSETMFVSDVLMVAVLIKRFAGNIASFVMILLPSALGN